VSQTRMSVSLLLVSRIIDVSARGNPGAQITYASGDKTY
jgi:hypothetical protein